MPTSHDPPHYTHRSSRDPTHRNDNPWRKVRERNHFFPRIMPPNLFFPRHPRASDRGKKRGHDKDPPVKRLPLSSSFLIAVHHLEPWAGFGNCYLGSNCYVPRAKDWSRRINYVPRGAAFRVGRIGCYVPRGPDWLLRSAWAGLGNCRLGSNCYHRDQRP